jgi:transcriptional regulator GlxA family with amidase domain
MSAQSAARPALRELQAWIAGHLDEDLSVAVLAARAHLSERSFARAFRAEVGQTPAAYVETLRVERARALLEDGAASLEAVARAAGFTSTEVLRRAFHRRVGVSPAAYRERFRAAV